jgi:hypothetical protein
MAPRGHSASQASQAAQCSPSTIAYLFGFAPFAAVFSIICHSLQIRLRLTLYIYILYFYDLLVKASSLLSQGRFINWAARQKARASLLGRRRKYLISAKFKIAVL